MTWLKKNWFAAVITITIITILSIFFGDRVKAAFTGWFKQKDTSDKSTDTTSTSASDTKSPQPPTVINYATPGDFIYANGDANVRRGPSTNAAIAYTANQNRLIGRLLSIVSAQGGTATGKWYQVQPDQTNLPYMEKFDELHYIYASLTYSKAAPAPKPPINSLSPFGK